MSKINFADLILFENEDFVLINKPPLMATLDERTQDRKTTSIIALLRNYEPTYQIAHRLDKETSGILAIAKHPEAYRHLAMAFERRKVSKIYHTIAEGVHQFEEQEATFPILKLSKKGMVTIDFKEGQKSHTTFQTLKHIGNFTLIEARPHTGRMHQIRIHLKALKAPIVADEMYGGRKIYLSEFKRKFNLGKQEEEAPIISRVALHAYAIGFEGLKGEQIHQEAPYPKDFAVLLKLLEKYHS
ncbi:MAG: RNA pseudouridine synthase [Thermonemataceae bacterium]|nr:RNA pseudouridine synthase [Thermonemataceae bacterium]